MKQAVVLTNSFDPHADYVVNRLQERGRIEVFRINTDHTPSLTDLEFNVLNVSGYGGCVRHRATGKELPIADIASVWVRRPEQMSSAEGMDEEEKRFSDAEARALLNGMLHGADALWVNDPSAERRASNKISQLCVAQELKWDIPRSVVTTNAEVARSFIDSCSEAIYKPLTHPLNNLSEGQESVHSGPTHVIDKSDLEYLPLLRECPALFQEYIPKKLEIRATVIGERVFPAMIDSQSTPAGVVDYREVLDKTKMQSTSLPVHIEQALVRLTRQFGLEYSAIDLIHTPDDRYVFLDLNPGGQYLWVELDVPELAITDALATLLEGSQPNAA